MRFPRPLLYCASLLIAFAACICASAQNFPNPKVIPTGNWPAAVYSADVNGDGFPDLIYIDQGATPGQPSTTHVLINDGHGNFSASATLATVGDSVAFGDLTGGGKVDIGWLSVPAGQAATATLHIAAGRGDGTFSATQDYTTTVPYAGAANNFVDLVAGQLHSSGPLDVIASDVDGTNLGVYAFRPGSAPGQAEVTGSPAYVVKGRILVKDVNGDGFPDIIVPIGADFNGLAVQTVAVFLCKGNGINGVPVNSIFTFYTRVGVSSFLIQDVNGDGEPDLIAEQPASGEIDIFPGNGDGSFQNISIGGTGTANGRTGNGGHLIAAGDFNHDGLLDALTATPIGISTLLGQGTQYLGLKGIYNAGPSPDSDAASYTVADFNGDGNPDLAINSPEGIAILYGNPDGSFQTNQAFAAGQPAMSGALARFTSTGNLNAIVTTGSAQAQLLEGQGDGTFIAAPTPTTTAANIAGLWSNIAIADFNGDGNPDLLIAADGPAAAIPAGTTGSIVQYGNGAAGFGAPISLTQPYAGCAEGAPNVPYTLTLYGNPIAGDFGVSPPADLGIRDPIGLVAFGGASGSGAPAYSTTYASGGSCLSQRHAVAFTGNFSSTASPDLIGQFGTDLILWPANPNASASIGFFNGPGTQDFSISGQLTTPGQTLAPVLSSTFGGTSPTLNFPAAISSMASADLDRDGDNNLVVVYANLSANLTAPKAAAPNKIYIWYGSGSGKFFTSTTHPVNPVVITPSRNFYQVVLVDLNGDNIPDLVLSDGYVLSIQLGKGDGTFGPEQHYLAGSGINTISVGDVNGDGKLDLVLANGGAVLTNPVANLEQLATNPDVNTGGITVLLNQPAALPALSGAVTASPEPSTYGSAFTLTAAFLPATPAPTGTLTFFIDGTAVSSPVAATGLNTTFAVPSSVYATLAVGTHTLSAAYSGDSNYQAATLSGSHTVSAQTSSNSVTASPEPSVYGSPFTITGTAPGPGTFNFSVDQTSIGSVVSSTNSAIISAPGTFAVGTHTLTLQWLAPLSAIATQVTGTHQVIQNPTTLSLLLCVDPPGSLFPCGTPLANTPLLSPVTMFFGQSLDGVATESATNLTGNIVFYDNTSSATNIFCTIPANLTGGANMCPTQSGYFNAGNYTVYAMYTGDANNQPSTSNSIQVIVSPDPTVANLTSSSNPAVVGTNVTFTFSISGNYATPSGTINVYSGYPFSAGNLLGTGILNASGIATLSTSSLPVGTYSIYAVFNGNSNFVASQSMITQVITPAVVTPPPPTGTGFTLTVAPDPVTVGAGATGILLVTVAGQSSQTPQVALTCSNLPIETTCIFVTPTLPAGGSATTLQLHVAAPHDCGAETPYFIGSEAGPASPVPYTFAAIFLGTLTLYRRRKTRKARAPFIPQSHRGMSGSTPVSRPDSGTTLLLLLTALASLASLSGCGHCTDLGTRPGNYTFTVTATPQGTSTSGTESVNIPLTVTIP